jgi:DNA-binding transcriptional LysR family regulator
VQQLEEFTGLKLLERTTRRVVPTAEGERFIPIAERLIRDFDSAISDLNATTDRRSGHVSLAVVPSIATQLMPDVLRTFSEKYPGISIKLTDDNSRGVQRRIVRNEVDLAICSKWRSNRELLFRPFLLDCLYLVCHRDHPLAKRSGPVSWKEVSQYQVLDSGMLDMLPISDLTEHSFLEFTTTSTLFAMVKANLGVTVLSSLATRDFGSNLVARELTGPRLKREVSIISRKNWDGSPALDAFLEVLLHIAPDIIENSTPAKVKCTVRPNDFPGIKIHKGDF